MDDERGQLLLVAGLVIAITFMILVLVLNTVIYTENLGTRSSDVGGDDAIAYERAAVDHTVELLPYHLPETDAETAFAEEIEEWVQWSQRHTLSKTNFIDVQVDEGTMRGTRIRHTDPDRAFTDAEDRATWTLATGVHNTPQFRIEELPVGEEGTSTSEGEIDVFTDRSGGPFRVVLTDDEGDIWWLRIYEGENSMIIAETNGGNECEIEDSSSTIDLVAGTVGSCEEIDPFTETVDGPYSIKYENGENIEGQYDLLVDVDVEENAENGPYSDPTASPYTTSAVYSATVEVTYENDRLTYESTIDVSPEGHRD